VQVLIPARRGHIFVAMRRRFGAADVCARVRWMPRTRAVIMWR
jgi:hypothetical protein